MIMFRITKEQIDDIHGIEFRDGLREDELLPRLHQLTEMRYSSLEDVSMTDAMLFIGWLDQRYYDYCITGKYAEAMARHLRMMLELEYPEYEQRAALIEKASGGKCRSVKGLSFEEINWLYSVLLGVEENRAAA